MSDLTAAELGQLCDEYWLAYKDRLAADKIAANLKTKESALKATIIDQLRLQKLTSIGGRLVRLSIDVEPEFVPTIEDFNKLAEYIFATRDISLLERRVSKSAVKERWAAETDVPGVMRFPTYKLHQSEVKG